MCLFESSLLLLLFAFSVGWGWGWVGLVYLFIFLLNTENFYPIIQCITFCQYSIYCPYSEIGSMNFPKNYNRITLLHVLSTDHYYMRKGSFNKVPNETSETFPLGFVNLFYRYSPSINFHNHSDLTIL